MSKFDDLKKSGLAVAMDSMGDWKSNQPTQGIRIANDPKTAGVKRFKNAVEIDLDRIDRDEHQPREEFEPEALSRLAESLKNRGQLQPIQVRWEESRGLYLIVVGERRFRAAKLAGMSSIVAVVREGPVSVGELLGIQIIENALREDLKPIEQAKAYQSLIDLNGWSGSDLSRELNIDRSSITRALSLLNLPAQVQEQVERGELAPSVAYEVSKIDDPAEQVQVAQRITTEGLSFSDVTRSAKKSTKQKGRGAKPKKITSQVFRSKVGAKVTIDYTKGLDTGLMVDIFLELVERLKGESSSQEAA